METVILFYLGFSPVYLTQLPIRYRVIQICTTLRSPCYVTIETIIVMYFSILLVDLGHPVFRRCTVYGYGTYPLQTV